MIETTMILQYIMQYKPIFGNVHLYKLYNTNLQIDEFQISIDHRQRQKVYKSDTFSYKSFFFFIYSTFIKLFV